jgi:hypothetical protein
MYPWEDTDLSQMSDRDAHRWHLFLQAPLRQKAFDPTATPEERAAARAELESLNRKVLQRFPVITGCILDE